METDLNLTTDTCFDNLCNDPKSIKVSPTALILEQVEKELINGPVDLNKIFKIEIYYNPSFTAHELTTVFKESLENNVTDKKLIFGWRRSTELLTLMMWEFQDQLHLFCDSQMVDVFLRMATSEDLGLENGKLYFGCQTIVYSYIVERLEPYFISFNPTTIAKSGFFYRKAGDPITANCLYNSKTKNVSLIKTIDAIIRKYC